MYETLIWAIIVGFIFGFLLWLLKSIIDHWKELSSERLILDYTNEELNKRRLCLDHYTEILSVLEQAKEIAFQKVWQEQILVQIGSGYKTDSKELGELGSDYVKLVLELCGPKIKEDFVIIHGNIESLCLFLLTGFVNRTIEDEAKMLTSVTNENSNIGDAQNVIKPPSMER